MCSGMEADCPCREANCNGKRREIPNKAYVGGCTRRFVVIAAILSLFSCVDRDEYLGIEYHPCLTQGVYVLEKTDCTMRIEIGDGNHEDGVDAVLSIESEDGTEPETAFRILRCHTM